MIRLSPELRQGVDIARQFAHLNPQQSAEMVAAHMRRFWSPAMREQLQVDIAHADFKLPRSLVLAAELLAANP
jgi:hypothetical protein